MRTYLANIDWNNLLTNKTAQNFKDEIEGITERIVPLRIQGKGPRRNPVKRSYYVLENLFTSRCCGGI